MDEGAQQQYDYISDSLKRDSPEGVFTRAQIDEFVVFYWGNQLDDYQKQREAVLEYTQATTSDPAEREQAAEKINAYFTAKEEIFNRDHDAALTELYRENGIPVEDKQLPEQTYAEYQAAKNAQVVQQVQTPTPQISKDENLVRNLDQSSKATEEGRENSEKGRLPVEKSYAQHQAQKEKEKEEKEPEKYEAVHQPTKKQIQDLSPGM